MVLGLETEFAVLYVIKLVFFFKPLFTSYCNLNKTQFIYIIPRSITVFTCIPLTEVFHCKTMQNYCTHNIYLTAETRTCFKKISLYKKLLFQG